MHWKVLKSENAIKNKFFTITKDKCEKEDGTIIDAYYTIHRPDVAVIGVFTENDELVLIDQYRHPLRSIDTELPAGYVEDYDNHLIEAALRELLEETGYATEKLEELQIAQASAGLMNNKIHFFIGFDAKKIQEPKLDSSESIKLRVTPWQETLKLLKQGKIKDMASITGILLIKEYLDERNLS